MKTWLKFINKITAQEFTPIDRPSLKYPGHSILLRLVLHRTEGEAQLEVDPPVDRFETLIALRPEEARLLAHQLEQAVGRLEDD
ncbi:MAG: hypothetical protein OXE76_05115 [Alphaproteobacteria bacterium]|nr:hypothetical protein [Alphaproteobacteria bacterium]